MRLAKRKATGALALMLAGALGCSQEHEARERSDAAVEAIDGQAAMTQDEDASTAALLDAEAEQDAEEAHPEAGSGALDAAPGAGEADAALGADENDASPPPTGQCDPQQLSVTRVIPQLMIVLDRSQSMAPAVPAGVSCLNFDILNANLLCQAGDQGACDQLACAGVDCGIPPYQGSVVCGGTNPSPSIDRWRPAVQGLEHVTEQFQAEIDFGLTIFPGQPVGTGSSGPGDDLCATGDVRVPIASNTAALIAQGLSATQPSGATPLGGTLIAVLAHLQARTEPPQARYVLLLTDGQPTCPNARGNTLDAQALAQDHALALQALDGLRTADVKTFVLGFVTPSETALAAALGEFAVHGGTERFYPVQDAQSIRDQFARIAAAVAAPCSLTLEAAHELGSLSVDLDAFELEPGADDGFVVQGTTLTLQGMACELFRDGREHRISVARSCVP